MHEPIFLDLSTIQTIRSLQNMVNHHKTVAAALEDAIYHSIQEQFNINLKEEDWTLDMDSGTLTRRETNGPTTP